MRGALPPTPTHLEAQAALGRALLSAPPAAGAQAVAADVPRHVAVQALLAQLPARAVAADCAHVGEGDVVEVGEQGARPQGAPLRGAGHMWQGAGVAKADADAGRAKAREAHMWRSSSSTAAPGTCSSGPSSSA